MPSAGLAELPSAGPRTGWPWTVSSDQLLERAPNGGRWPRLSIVTPSYNQGAFLEEAIRSVLLQGYPDVEYVIVDGGSSDSSVATIRAYAPWLTHWESERDEGQAHAINKGLRRVSGDIVAYLNSDDVYRPGAFRRAVAALMSSPRAVWLCGTCVLVDETAKTERLLRPHIPDPFEEWLLKPSGRAYSFPQPGVFLRRAAIDRLGLFREDLHYSFDYEYWLRLLFNGFRPVQIDNVLATFRVHSTSKTAMMWSGFERDDLAIAKLYASRASAHVQRAIARQQQAFRARRTVNACWRLAGTRGRRFARRVLWARVRREPSLLAHRCVWGALRRWYGVGSVQA
jgi:glycosyltransferase involved in cell wall biosynthesis